MRSTLLLVVFITMLVLVIRKYIMVQENKKTAQAKNIQRKLIKNAYSLLPEDLKLIQLHNY